MAVRRGHLYWANLDKRRPVLVVSSDRFNLRSSYVTIVPGSTRLRPLVTHVRLTIGQGGVTRPTMLLCEHVHTIRHEEVLGDALGPALPADVMRSVSAALRFYLELDGSTPAA